MKKYIELHLHLDGAITIDIAKKLADLQEIILPAADDRELLKLLSVPEECENLNDFLKCFALPLTLLQTKEGIREAVYLVMEEQKKQGVVYAEIRFAPQLHCEKGLTQEDAVLAAVEGLKKSAVMGNLILCCMRGGDNDRENRETVELAKKYLVKNGRNFSTENLIQICYRYSRELEHSDLNLNKMEELLEKEKIFSFKNLLLVSASSPHL